MLLVTPWLLESFSIRCICIFDLDLVSCHRDSSLFISSSSSFPPPIFIFPSLSKGLICLF